MPLASAPGAFSSTPSSSAYLSRLLNPTVTPAVTSPAYAPNTVAPIVQLSPTALTPFPSATATPQAHENRQPFATFRYCICVTDGEYPVRP